MTKVFSVLRSTFRKSTLLLASALLTSLLGMLLASGQPSYASTAPAQKLSPEATQIRRDGRLQTPSQTALDRERSYEETAQAAESLKSQEQTYEQDLKNYKESQPDKGLVEGVKDVIEKVTSPQ